MTGIPYANESWSPMTGCSKGCPYCWSRALAHRFGRSFAPTFHADKLAVPLHWRKPRTVVVAFNGDLFDPHISDEQIAAVFGVMAACPAHRFLVLTKRAERMEEWFAWIAKRPMPEGCGALLPMGECFKESCKHLGDDWRDYAVMNLWPLPNVWLGVSVTNQADADERIPHLLRCPAAVRWASAEPLLESISLRLYSKPWVRRSAVEYEVTQPALDWVAAGFRSGPHAPPGDLAWARGLRDQCAAAVVAFAWKNPTGFPPLDGVVHDAMPKVGQ